MTKCRKLSTPYPKRPVIRGPLLNGTHHKIGDKHLPRYLAEFCYRFNRRFDLEKMFSRLGYVAARTPPMPLRLLILSDPLG
ncbi:MAG: transposase [Candidatus Thiodiazotropha sp. (ex Epidulcina cf. delphinae)]|nr:transposase [Candidatus Thiodiazotropha sp. (ex Epidulcina cf. delphinae)]